MNHNRTYLAALATLAAMAAMGSGLRLKVDREHCQRSKH
jgi:hypothetical protein